MHRFFIPPSGLEGKTVRIRGQDAHHMKNVLRLKEGEEVSIVIEGNEKEEYRCGVRSLEKDEAILELYFIKPLSAELPVRVTICQALPKADKMELVVQKAVELGAAGILPLITKRCVSDWGAKTERKLERLNRIARSAAEQSGRGILPEVAPPMELEKALALCRQEGRILFPYELAEGMGRTREVLSSVRPGEKVFVFIGPEGGFTEEEVSLARSSGAGIITLGRRILRTETAALYLLSVLGYLLEENEEYGLSG